MKLKQLAALSLSIIALSTYADANKGYTLDSSDYKTIVDPEGKSIARLYDNFESLSAISSYKDKIVAMGELDFGQMIAIIDPAKGEAIDSFMNFYLSNPWGEARTALVSPSGRYLIYRKFHSAFSPEVATSNFAMIYDLEKSPAENRISIQDLCGDEEEVCPSEDEENTCVGSINAGKFFFPENEDLSCSTCSPYKTYVESDEQYLYILGNRWDAPRTVLQLSYTKSGKNDFMILEEKDEVLSQKILKFADAKLFDAQGNAIEYTPEVEDKFYMVDFSLDNNTLTIVNLKDSSPVSKMIFEL